MWVVINVDPYKSAVTSTVGDGALDVPNPFHSTSPTREANEAYCRGGACSSRDPSDIYHQTAKQISVSVGTTTGRPGMPGVSDIENP